MANEIRRVKDAFRVFEKHRGHNYIDEIDNYLTIVDPYYRELKRAIDALPDEPAVALPRSPKWTSELPTEPGLYLWKAFGFVPSLLKVWKERQGLGVWNDNEFIPISSYRGDEFAGPIPESRESEEPKQ